MKPRRGRGGAAGPAVGLAPGTPPPAGAGGRTRRLRGPAPAPCGEGGARGAMPTPAPPCPQPLRPGEPAPGAAARPRRRGPPRARLPPPAPLRAPAEAPKRRPPLSKAPTGSGRRCPASNERFGPGFSAPRFLNFERRTPGKINPCCRFSPVLSLRIKFRAISLNTGQKVDSLSVRISG